MVLASLKKKKINWVQAKSMRGQEQWAGDLGFSPETTQSCMQLTSDAQLFRLVGYVLVTQLHCGSSFSSNRGGGKVEGEQGVGEGGCQCQREKGKRAYLQ